MPLDKPTTVPRWAETPGRRLEPTETRKDSGWYISDYPPAEEFNWINGLSGDWLKWIDERLGQDALDPSVFALLNPVNATLQLQTIPAGGIKIGRGLNVGFDGASLVGSVCVGDPAFCMLYGGGSPMLQFDAAADSMRFDRAANVFSWHVGSVGKLSLGASGLMVGAGTPVFPFQISETVSGVLGSLVGDALPISSVDHFSGDTIDLLTYAYRHAPGSTWTTESTYVHFGAESGSERHGFVRFSGDQVASSYGIGAHVGIGSGAQGGQASLFVDSAAAYAHVLLPLVNTGPVDGLSRIGTPERPWGVVSLADNGDGISGAVKSYATAGGPATLNLDAMNGTVRVGRLSLVGAANVNDVVLNCASQVGYIEARSCSAWGGGPDGASRRGFWFRDSAGFPADGTGMFYSQVGALQLWKQMSRMVDIYGRTGFPSDVQLTLGRGSGLGATTGDLRDFACVCQDFLSADAANLLQGDLVVVSGAADHAVTKTTAGGQLGAVGFVVDSAIIPGGIGRIATSGIVLARTAGTPVTRGDFVQASATAGRVTPVGFGNSVVGVALQSAGQNTYFRLLIRFGG